MSKPLTPRMFAKLVGASLSTVQERLRKGLLKRSATRDRRGRWQIDPAMGTAEWHVGTALREHGPKTAGEVTVGPDDAVRLLRAKADKEQDLALKAREDARKAAADAQLAEADLLERQGKLVSARDMELEMVRVFTACKTKLLGIPSRARQQDPALTTAQLALFEALIREALTELASKAGEAPEGGAA